MTTAAPGLQVLGAASLPEGLAIAAEHDALDIVLLDHHLGAHNKPLEHMLAALVALLQRQSLQSWHQSGTSQPQKAKKSAGANRLTFALLGSPTWARTRDLRINSLLLPCFLGPPGIFWDG